MFENTNKKLEEAFSEKLTVSNPVEAVVSGEFKVSKQDALKNTQDTFDKCINKGDLVGASIAAAHMKEIASSNSC